MFPRRLVQRHPVDPRTGHADDASSDLGPARRIAAAALTTLAVAMLSVGCSSPTRAAPSDLDGLAALVYPDAAERGDDLDVFVTRRGSVLDLQNMSTRRIGFEQIWLNRAYVSTIDGLNVGEQATLSLDWFRNRHGETYPRGTFLAPERNLPLVLAELFDPGSGRRHRLIVRLGRD